MAVKISKKIVGYTVVSKDDRIAQQAAEEAAEQQAQAVPAIDYDPLVEEMAGAPMGVFDAKRYGAEYHHPSKGKQSLFVSISYTPAKGLIGGEEAVAERPFEMFMPGGQREDIQPWVTTVMKLSSLLLQQGVPMSRILKRFDAPGSDMIPFARPTGKKKFFTSEVQVVGQAFLNLAYEMGICDEEGNDIPFESRAVRPGTAPASAEEPAFKAGLRSVGAMEAAQVEQEGVGDPVAFMAMGKTCPDCRGDAWNVQAPCPVCECGYSSCG